MGGSVDASQAACLSRRAVELCPLLQPRRRRGAFRSRAKPRKRGKRRAAEAISGAFAQIASSLFADVFSRSRGARKSCLAAKYLRLKKEVAGRAKSRQSRSKAKRSFPSCPLCEHEAQTRIERSSKAWS